VQTNENSSTGIFLYNSLSRQKEELVPRETGKVSLYVCGVTPYDALHIGHARAFVVYDVLRRFFESRGLEVVHVQNVTDIDDKIINRAAEQGVPALELASRFADEAGVELEQLNVLPAHHYPRVTGHIPPIVEMVKVLEAKGYAYSRGGDVYFDVSKDEDYGKLSNQKLEELEAGARIDPGEHKDDPMDFALWKAAKPGEPAWDSPWGPGRPGWHIECSAMALEILGPGFDIHGGARELMFPHHENEVAQSESYLDGHEFAHTWWHCGVVQVNGKKMGKSLGNFVTVQKALQDADKNVWRLFFLMTHPRSPLDYTPERLDQSKSAWNRLYTALSEGDGEVAANDTAAQEFAVRFSGALSDDLNTPVALSAVFDAVTEVNRTQNSSLAAAARTALESLGFTFEESTLGAGLGELIPQLVDLLIEVRQDARERRDFKGSDLIRNRLKDIGILLEDTPEGTRWKVEA
jgi:cysteinyl-tRNA synthetase